MHLADLLRFPGSMRERYCTMVKWRSICSVRLAAKLRKVVKET